MFRQSRHVKKKILCVIVQDSFWRGEKQTGMQMCAHFMIWSCGNSCRIRDNLCFVTVLFFFSATRHCVCDHNCKSHRSYNSNVLCSEYYFLEKIQTAFVHKSVTVLLSLTVALNKVDLFSKQHKDQITLSAILFATPTHSPPHLHTHTQTQMYLHQHFIIQL